MNDAPAILLCGHGTTDPEALAGFARLLDNLRRRLPGRRVSHGFLELAEPGFGSALASLHAEGVRVVIALPVLLLTAGHYLQDIPAALASALRPFPDLKLTLARPLGLSPAVVETACRVVEASLPLTQDRADTALLLVGRGTSDPVANADVAKLARLIQERLGLGFATSAYIAVTTPKPEAAFRQLELLPHRNAVFMPFVVFDGMLYKDLVGTFNTLVSESKKHWSLTAPLASESPWIDTFLERLEEAEAGRHARLVRATDARHDKDHTHPHELHRGTSCSNAEGTIAALAELPSAAEFKPLTRA